MKILSTMRKSKIRDLCYDGHHNHLYLEAGSMLAWYARGRERPSLIRAIAVAYDDPKKPPVAMAVLLKRMIWDANVGVYVQYRYRRKGIGRELIRRLRKRVPEKNLHPHPHDTKSIKFFWSVRGMVRTNINP